MQIPIACTLNSEGATARLEEWRLFFGQSVDAVERIDQGHLRVRLRGSKQAMDSAVDLARREKACCTFFDFSIDLEADSSWLSVRVPLDATGILAEFASLLPQQL